MKSIRLGLLLLSALAFVSPALQSAEENNGSYMRFYGTGASNGDTLFTAGAASAVKWDSCILMSTTGSVSVFVSLDGTIYSSTALTLQDFGATDGSTVAATAALRVYGFVSKARFIQVKQVGGTAASASMNCWSS